MWGKITWSFLSSNFSSLHAFFRFPYLPSQKMPARREKKIFEYIQNLRYRSQKSSVHGSSVSLLVETLVPIIGGFL